MVMVMVISDMLRRASTNELTRNSWKTTNSCMQIHMLSTRMYVGLWVHSAADGPWANPGRCVCVLCCPLPLAKCGKRAARRGPKHALLAMFGSKRLKLRAETLLSTGAGRLTPRAALPWVVLAAADGKAKCLGHLCHAIEHGHIHDEEAWQPLQLEHQTDLVTLYGSNCESEDR